MKLTRKKKQLEGSPQAGGSGTPVACAGVVLPIIHPTHVLLEANP